MRGLCPRQSCLLSRCPPPSPSPYAGIKNNTRERGSVCHPECKRRCGTLTRHCEGFARGNLKRSPRRFAPRDDAHTPHAHAHVAHTLHPRHGYIKVYPHTIVPAFCVILSVAKNLSASDDGHVIPEILRFTQDDIAAIVHVIVRVKPVAISTFSLPHAFP